MKICNVSFSKLEAKINKITLVLILSGIITSLCLIFFFVQLFNAKKNSVTPIVFKAEQIGATDSSVLIVWSSSDAAKEFIVRYRSTDSSEYNEYMTDKPFAAIRDLKAGKRYKATVAPVDGDKIYESVTVICNTSPYCNVTSVSVDEVTNNSAHVKWEYSGIDDGFTIAAYALDKNGKRHVKSENIIVPAGSAKECVIENLLSELNYTVCVMPNTRYATAGKSTFTTEKYSKLYNKLNIVRFVICENDSDDSIFVSLTKNLASLADYKTSTIISGQVKPNEKINVTTYITDTESNIISHCIYNDICINPEDIEKNVYTTVMTSFRAPEKTGDYIMHIAFDGVTVSKIDFKVM